METAAVAVPAVVPRSSDRGAAEVGGPQALLDRPGSAPGLPPHAKPHANSLARLVLWWFDGGAVTTLALGGLAVLAVVSFRAVQGPSAAVTTLESGGTLTVVVEPGDTYWSLASELSPGRDPRPLVAELRRQVGTPALQAGQVVILSAPGTQVAKSAP